MRIVTGILFLLLTATITGWSQTFQFGMETITGPARTTFKGDLASVIGFSEIEISESIVDSALAQADIEAPRWLKELYPGIRIPVEGDITRKMTRNVSGVRFFARFEFFGASFSVSRPRLTQPLESQKLGNQIKAVRLSLGGKAEELAEHVATMAVADAQRVDPFFSNRYDLEAYVHLKRLFLGDQLITQWGKRDRGSLDFEVTSGLRFTADPSPVVDLGSVLFISETLDSLMQGRLLDPVENVTDEIAVAIQNVVFGKFKDPRTVPSMGWFLRGQLLANLNSTLALVAGAEFSVNNHLSIKGTRPMTSYYGFIGFRINMIDRNDN